MVNLLVYLFSLGRHSEERKVRNLEDDMSSVSVSESIGDVGEDVEVILSDGDDDDEVNGAEGMDCF